MRAALTGLQALELFHASKPDAILLNMDLPDIEGLEVLRRLRTCSDVPVLIITGSADIENLVESLDSGADDYLVKPFAFRELMARIRAIFRRRGLHLRPTLRSGDVVLDRRAVTVTRAGRPIELTALEFRLLEFLITHPGYLLSRDQILGGVWGYEYAGATNVVNVHISLLRKKLGDTQNRMIRSVRGEGYIWESFGEVQ